MNARTNRWLVWTGPLFAVIWYVGAFALSGSSPGETASASKVISYYESHRGRTLTEVFLAPLGCALLVLFASQVRELVRGRTRTPGAGPLVMLAGSVIWGLGLLIGATATLTVVSASHHGQAQVAVTANVLSNDTWLPFIAGIAVTLIGAGMTVLQTGLLPRWMGYVALVAGIASLAGPAGFVGWVVAPLWLLVGGIMLWRRPSVVDLTEPPPVGETTTAPTTGAAVEP